MKYHDPNHSSVIIESPTVGHFVITGHNPASILDPEQGYIVPPRETYVAPECPSSALRAILEERGEMPVPVAAVTPASTFQERVIAEKDELEDKAKKLSEFIGNNPKFQEINPDEQERLKVQNDLMWQYFEVLEARIAEFEKKDETPEKPKNKGGRPRKETVKTEGAE